MKLTRDQNSLKAITGLIEYAFKKQQPIIDDSLFLSRYEHADCYGVYQDDELTNLVMANHFEIQLFNQRVKMAGVGYVASYPEYRGKGGISTIMLELLSDLHQKGVAVSQLAPFSEDFYRQFGYEPTSRRKTYRIPALAFNYLTSEKRGSVKRGSWQQMESEIKKLYQRLLMKQQVGTVVREDWWWERLNHYYAHRFYAVAFNEAGEAKGYLIYRMQGATLLVDELVYEDVFALRKLLTYLKAHVSSFEEFLYHAPVHERIEKCFREQEALSITLEPYMMSRIIDIEQLLPHFPICQKEIIIEVTEDQECPWNVGSWLVSQGMCRKVQQAGDIKASIHGWSELLLGELTLAEGIFLGKVTTSKDFDTDVFPKGQQSFYDYF
ncbi:GNAT family N-acetyltransferase [Enterococcus devriesei]|uniref:GNAT family N-acetyltransferase n=1 Tax=Enterococcus devriesei TaxID=319970 RepID=UPI001C1022C4|nr:GNAT family N-acetyltransferase [Enterococcus devriesei]MBU5365060.1 GNAT family N-acetyltransferase [Enterococcus devriesei]MDT2821485.1 GNAT family N-acetyltransferase [Enterococcus devriesei]